MEVVSHDFSYQKPFYTLYCQEASRRDRDVNACGNAHPEDKVKAEADPFALFPMSGDQQRSTRESDELFPGVSLWGVSQLSSFSLLCFKSSLICLTLNIWVCFWWSCSACILFGFLSCLLELKRIKNWLNVPNFVHLVSFTIIPCRTSLSPYGIY